MSNFKSNIDRFFETMRQSRVAFVGAGVSHNDLIRLFRKKGIAVTLLDKKYPGELGDIYDEFQELGVSFRLGESYLYGLTDFNVIFRAPGVYYENDFFHYAKEHGVVITSEMEIFFQLCPCRIIAVTGSDGKTTTTTLISEFMRRSGYRVFLGGNIGKPLLSRIEEIQERDVAVVELSSFQLLSMRQSPEMAVITNISPNHLDVHGNMEEYIYAKGNIIAHQDAFSRAVLNQDNELVMTLAPLVRGVLHTFSCKERPGWGAYLRDDGMLCFADGDLVTPVVHKDRIRIPGMHNVENYLAAITATWGYVAPVTMRDTAETFHGVEHRIEFVRQTMGVGWFNDSIATTPTRAAAGLNAFSHQVIVIMGGYDKKIPFEPMADTVCLKAKMVLLMGATADKIEAAIRGSQYYQEGAPELIHVSSMEEAVKVAYNRSETGDAVLLSPACASFDVYPNYESRGKHFKKLVREIQ